MVHQGLNQAYRFKRFPEEAELALEGVMGSFERMQALCSANGVEFLAVVLPAKIDVDLEDRREDFEDALDLLDLGEEEAGLNRRLSARFAAELLQRGISCIDPTEQMRAASTVFYWRTDDHLAPAGHAFLAQRLLEELRGRL